jgi:hypothetical protein
LKFGARLCVSLVCGIRAAVLKMLNRPEMKNPAGFVGEQGSRNR